MPEFVRVASLLELEAGKIKSLNISGKAIALANVEGALYAIDNFCLHRGGPLGDGFLEGERVECPWHGWQFNVKNGCKVMNPEMKLVTYEVRVIGSDVWVCV